jgi:hypothetical protein
MPQYNYGTIASYDIDAVGEMFLAGTTQNTWPTANKAVVIPFEVHQDCIAMQIGWFNGSAVNGSVDAGIYDIDGNLLTSIGSGHTQTGTTAIEVVDVTDAVLNPGIYQMALVLSSASGRISYASIGTTIPNCKGIREISSSYPLTTLPTFSTSSMGIVPMMFVALRSTL